MCCGARGRRGRRHWRGGGGAGGVGAAGVPVAGGPVRGVDAGVGARRCRRRWPPGGRRHRGAARGGGGARHRHPVPGDRGEVDRRAPRCRAGSASGRGPAASRVAAELDAASVVARIEAAARSRRVTVRPAPDGMAYLTVLGPLQEVVGAHAGCWPTRGRWSRGSVSRRPPTVALPGRSPRTRRCGCCPAAGVGDVQPVEVHLVITDRGLLGTGDPAGSCSSPAGSPGYGPVPAPVARAWLRDGLDEVDATDRVRLHARRRPGSAGHLPGWTGPGRDGLAAAGVRRVLRRMLVLRDDACCTPWCGAPIVHADHTTAVREGGAAPPGATAAAPARAATRSRRPPAAGHRDPPRHRIESHCIDQHHGGPARTGAAQAATGPRARPCRRDRGQPRHRPREVEVAPRPGTPTAATYHH